MVRLVVALSAALLALTSHVAASNGDDAVPLALRSISIRGEEAAPGKTRCYSRSGPSAEAVVEAESTDGVDKKGAEGVDNEAHGGTAVTMTGSMNSCTGVQATGCAQGQGETRESVNDSVKQGQGETRESANDSVKQTKGSKTMTQTQTMTRSGLAGPPTMGTVSNSTMAANSSSKAGWWFGEIARQGRAPYNENSEYKVFRNVKDFGAVGDGQTDDTKAINEALSSGGRCGQGCNSSTITPAIVYFPPGTYLVSAPLIPYYYSQMVGDAIGVPTLKAAAEFEGIAVIDADPYLPGGSNWYLNTNNFFRQVRNFRVDVRAQPLNAEATGIHWQVAQATSLENIEFYMRDDASKDNKQRGLLIENGSGGFMANLTFVGGSVGASLGSQQFTVRDASFRNCQTAISMAWNWVWSLQNMRIDNCQLGLDMAGDGPEQTVGSIVLLDSVISNTPVGLRTAYSPDQSDTNGTLVLDNVDMSANVPVAVESSRNGTLVPGNTKIESYVQGRAYKGTSGQATQGIRPALPRPAALVDARGNFVSRGKPAYRDVPVSSFVSVKAAGAKGDGVTDDTQALQALFSSLRPEQVVYFDHGSYIVTDTIQLPSNVKIVGEVWPLIMAAGDKAFKDQANPQPVFRVGNPGDEGLVEIQDIVLSTQGPQPGAILLQFNVRGSQQASTALWDVHFRVGGFTGTHLQSDRCAGKPDDAAATPDPNCMGAFMLLHVTPQASIYMENTWLWVADHELDIPGEDKLTIFNGRGLVLESTQGAWLYGTASEHSVLSNYQISNAKNVFMALIQTETAYFQGLPDARKPFVPNPTFFDPDFDAECTDSPTCARTWGLRVQDSSDVFLYGGGLYSLFDKYNESCALTNNCQDNMVNIARSQVHLAGLSTKASTNMITLDGAAAVLDADNRNNFCGTVAMFEP
ncbi:hypothetical protein CDD81_7986 [Ophiocordyceps australis]|uniref:Rhamnogalacturonase A/B/Epimerase-like pectate lyase domain-containing protein n=1 Tax=Ophiocordyceps australis TaxID=1399860 RepID=A0A2C5XWZ4_9HYPO|nr:hypothetical protein CDD81_7986 [Ophiocordyceps australis]